MLRTTQTELEKAGVLNRLVADYLKREKKLSEFYEYYPDSDGFKSILKQASFTKINRPLLVNTLKTQAARVNNTSELTQQNIEKLNDANCYTVTTGHQVCLFTGPLYFIYKIYSTINLAKQIAQENPGKIVVPVYWMATEDHDFEEVNHFFVNGKKILWNSKQTGAVGNFKTAPLKDILETLKDALGISENSKYLISLFERAYLKHPDLSTATHYLVNELFGQEGLLVLDANDRELKKEFSSDFESDLFEHKAETYLKETNAKLERFGYHVQVQGRQINCFYLEENLRARIERSENRFQVVGTETFFSESQIKEIVKKTPEKLSPNVVLRPLFQQKILPNVAYVGGPGELAYWLEMLNMFKRFGIQFPILVPRTFVTVVDELTQLKAKQLNIDLTEIFKSEQDLILLIQKEQGKSVTLNAEEDHIKTLFSKLTAQLSSIDTTLEKGVKAAESRVLKGITTLEKKANRALRTSLEVEKNRITAIRAKIFPEDQPQERVLNFSEFYLMYGADFLKTISSIAHPLDQKMKIVLG